MLLEAEDISNPLWLCAKAAYNAKCHPLLEYGFVPYPTWEDLSPASRQKEKETTLAILLDLKASRSNSVYSAIVAEAKLYHLIAVDEQCARIAACALVVQNGLVLGVARKNDSTAWGLPGGKVDPGETVLQALGREIYEECGVEIVKAIPFYEGTDDGRYYTFTFLTEITGTPYQPNPSEGHVAFISWDMFCSGPYPKYNNALREKYFREKIMLDTLISEVAEDPNTPGHQL